MLPVMGEEGDDFVFGELDTLSVPSIPLSEDGVA